jgi:hypothetical protein
MTVTYYMFVAGHAVVDKNLGTWGNTGVFDLTDLEVICFASKWADGPTIWRDKVTREVYGDKGLKVMRLFKGKIEGKNIISMREFMEAKGFGFLELKNIYSSEENMPSPNPPYDIGTGLFLPGKIKEYSLSLAR